MMLEFPLPEAILDGFLRTEEDAVEALLLGYRPEPEQIEQTQTFARDMLVAIRNAKPGIRIETLLKEYSLDNQEGVTLMCMAEALLRIPDAATSERFVEDLLRRGNWAEHLGHSEASWVNASTWGLLITGKLLGNENLKSNWFMDGFKGILRRLGEPLALSAVRQAMTAIGHQFILGETMADALTKAQKDNARGYSHAFDMLGEAAMTQAAAEAYKSAYHDSILAVSNSEAHRLNSDISSISIKLSALHPRVELRQREAQAQLLDNLMDLLLVAHEHDVAITIDAEEAVRTETSLMLFAQALSHNKLRQWGKLGIAVQAYQKRAPDIIQWLMDISRTLHSQIPVRLVKGAYWDTEIKYAQQQGLVDYPVYSQKDHTDLSYLYCANSLFKSQHFLYPQFATHNAHTVASILTLADKLGRKQYEFQRLHGMGEALYDHVLETVDQAQCRIYAPVGRFSELLPYLVRRMLENGANTSFVRQVQLAQSDDAWLIEEPSANIKAMKRLRNPRIPRPHQIYYPQRKNARGMNLEGLRSLQQLSKTMLPLLRGYDSQAISANNNEQGVNSPAQPEQCLGKVPLLSSEQCQQLKAVSEQGWLEWRRLNPEERVTRLENAARLMEAQAEELMLLLMLEAGKTLASAQAELREAVDFIHYYGNQARNLFTPTPLPSVTGEANTHSRESKGPVLCISPWNFPLAIFTGQVVAALAAGNSVLAKPALNTPLVARKVVELLHEAGVPEATLSLITATNQVVSESLIAPGNLGAVLFTGSHASARHINQTLAAAPGPIVPLIAETSGQNAMIVDSSALIEQVTKDIARSAFDSAGQRCSALRILFVQKEIKQRLLEMLFGYLDQLNIGNPLDWEMDIGPIINAAALKQLQDYVASWASQGRVLYQGQAPDSTGHYMAPAVIELEQLSELPGEQFGPILHVISFEADQIEQLVQQINATNFGLTLGIHSRINSMWESIAHQVRVGNVYINRDMIGATVGAQPFGGQGLSGTGPKAGGPNYLLSLTNEKTLTVNTAAMGGNIKLLTDD